MRVDVGQRLMAALRVNCIFVGCEDGSKQRGSPRIPYFSNAARSL
jgi:hypothetical protein